LLSTRPYPHNNNQIVSPKVPKRDGKKSPGPTVWKVKHCTALDFYFAEVNGKPHVRGSRGCTIIGAPQLTPAMKGFVSRQDVGGQDPRHILNNMKKEPGISKPKRGWPTPKQIANALKYIRVKDGTKNSIAAVEKLVRGWPFSTGIDPKKAILFSPLLNDDGHVHVGNGEDEDPTIAVPLGTAV
jgi:hypothetical protein